MKFFRSSIWWVTSKKGLPVGSSAISELFRNNNSNLLIFNHNIEWTKYSFSLEEGGLQLFSAVVGFEPDPGVDNLGLVVPGLVVACIVD